MRKALWKRSEIIGLGDAKASALHEEPIPCQRIQRGIACFPLPAGTASRIRVEHLIPRPEFPGLPRLTIRHTYLVVWHLLAMNVASLPPPLQGPTNPRWMAEGGSPPPPLVEKKLPRRGWTSDWTRLGPFPANFAFVLRTRAFGSAIAIGSVFEVPCIALGVPRVRFGMGKGSNVQKQRTARERKLAKDQKSGNAGGGAQGIASRVGNTAEAKEAARLEREAKKQEKEARESNKSSKTNR